MLKKITGVLLIQLSVFISFGQSKLNLHLQKEIYKGNDKTHTLLVKGNIDKIKREIVAFSGSLNYSAKDVASITMPLSRVAEFAKQPYVQRVELMNQKLRVLDDSSLRKNKILNVHSGSTPLPAAYTGSNVLIGIIDTGTDFNHPDFKDANGNTRIAYLWDQNFFPAANTPQPYNYGQEWSAADINNNLCTHIDNTDMGHGTKVAGVAAGNGASASKYKGIAPDASIITVAIDFSNQGPTIVDAVDYIVNKANTLGMPVVINISLGDYFGSHDGKDLQAQLIDNIINNAPGRAVVAAAGNAGGVKYHVGYNVSAVDTNFTWLTNATHTINFQVYADSADFKLVNFRVGLYQYPSFNYKGHTPFNTIDPVVNNLTVDTLKFNNNRMGIVKTLGDFSNSVYALDVTILADSISYLWAFETNGTGKVDSWSLEYVSTNLPATSQFTTMAYYKVPDTLQTICSSFQCSKDVITVGNYTDRLGFIDVSGTLSPFPGVDGGIFPTSSMGPTRDGRIKPEITATGENIVTTGSFPILSWLIQNFPYVVTQDSLHMIFGGTSASAPVVTGLAALYFEKYPTRTAQQLKQDIVNCSYQDSFTGNVPNDTWGYGKLDGFGALICSQPLPVGLQKNTYTSIFTVYPNPSSGIFSFKLEKPVKLSVYDQLGRILIEKQFQKGDQNVDLRDYTNGIYLLKITDNTETSIIKLIKND